MLVKTGPSTLIEVNTGGGARPVMAFAGQSNVGGIIDIASLEAQYQQSYDNVRMYPYSTSNKLLLTPLLYTNNPSYQAPIQTAKFAFQFYLYPQLQGLLSKRIYVVHHAQGGTSLAVDWLPSTAGGLYEQLVFKTQCMTRAIYDCDGINTSFKFLFWGQGESDAQVLAQANAYEANLTSLISAFRSDVGMGNIPVLVARLSSNINATTCPYWATVRAAQEAVAGAVSGVYIVNQDNATMQADGIHYTNAGYQQIATNTITVAQNNGLL